MPDALTDPLAQELAKLAPAPSAVTSASVLFAAGQQSVELKANRWRNATAGMALLFVCSWIGMAVRPESNRIPDQGIRDDRVSGSNGTLAMEEPRPSFLNRDNDIVLAKPIPQLVATLRPDEDTLELRAKGLRLKHDILAGGLGMIPDEPKSERPRVPNASSMELNPAVLGGHYAPKNDPTDLNQKDKETPKNP